MRALSKGQVSTDPIGALSYSQIQGTTIFPPCPEAFKNLKTRLYQGSAGEEMTGNEVPEAAQFTITEGKGSHGSHWGSVLGDTDRVQRIIRETVETGDQGSRKWNGFNFETGKKQENTTVYCTKNMGSIRSVVLVVNGSLWSAYPAPASKAIYPLEGLHSILRWPNLVEGQWGANLLGASLIAFDPYFFRHQGRPPQTNRMRFSGLAYAVRKAGDHHLVGNGMRRSTKGSALLLPYEGGYPDDWMFRMPIETVTEVDMMGSSGYRFTGPVFIGKDASPFTIPVYAATHAIQGPLPEPGDDLEGTFWLQGSFVMPVHRE